MARRRFLIATAASALAAAPAFAQEAFPSHAITIINAFLPGGANDIVTWPLATAMEPILKQPVVVETKAGAAQFVAAAKPDGYTLLSHNTGISGYAEVDKLFGRSPKITRAHFIPLARLVAEPIVLLVNDQQPYKTLSEFIAAAKAHPDTLVFNSGGLYGASHLPLAYLEKATGPLRLRHLPTNGGRARHRRHPRQQCAGHNPIGVGHPAAHQSRQAAPARRFQRSAFEVVARCADAQGARPRPPLLSVGRDIRAQRYACGDRDDAARRHRQGGAIGSIKDRARQRRSGARLSRRPGFPEVLGPRRQANRRGGDIDRPAWIADRRQSSRR